MQQTEQKGTFLFQADFDGVLHVDCTRIPEQEGASSFQANVGENPEKPTTVQVAAHQEFARLMKIRQQRWVIAWSTERNKQFEPGKVMDDPLLSASRWPFRVPVFSSFFCLFVGNYFCVY